MPRPADSQLEDTQLRERIVMEVMRRLMKSAEHQQTEAGAGSSPASGSRPDTGNGKSAAGKGAARTGGKSNADHRSPSTTLWEAVVSVAQLVRLPPDVRRVRVQPRAVVTPAARDWLGERGVALERVSSASEANPAASRWLLAVDHTGPMTEPLEQLVLDVMEAVEILRDTCPDRISRRLAEGVRASYQALWITDRPLLAACRANRHQGVRAGWVFDRETARQATEHLQANVFIVDSKRHSIGEWQNMLQVIGRLSARTAT